MNEIVADKLALYLLQIKAIKLNPQNPFTWTSGWRSPIYCDNRKTLSYPEVRTYIKQSLADLIQKQYPSANKIAGVATAGIPHGALVADLLNLPFAYVRTQAKTHGLKNTIEGEIKEGDDVVVIEDLISTGKSSIAAIQSIREVGAKVIGLGAIFTYGFDIANNNFLTNKCDFFALSSYSALLKKALEQNFIEEEQLPSLHAWRMDPENWHN